MVALMRRSLFALAFLTCISASVPSPRQAQAASPEASPRILIGPYVSAVGSSSASVLWVSEPGERGVPVSVRGGGRAFEVPSVASPVAGRAEMLHAARLDGLRPFTRYQYRVRPGNGAAAGSFRTAPAGPTAFRFVVYGDTRSRPDQHRLVAAAIAREDPAFVICAGDLVADGQKWELWGPEFFDPARAYLSRAAFWPVRGNHEGDAVLMRALFDLVGGNYYYSFDAGNAHCVVLDNYAPDRRAMLDWLKDDLARSRADWTFVAYHEPTFNVGGHGSTWGQDDVLPILERGGVDFVLTGHSHLYERFLPIGPAGAKPVIHIVTAGGGAPLHVAGPSPILAGGMGKAELHYCLFEISGRSCELTVKRPDGSVMDRLRLVKRDGTYQREVMAQAVETGTARALTFAFADMKVDLPAVPKPGQKVLAALVGPRLPAGCSLDVRPAGGRDAWGVPPQTVVPAQGGFQCELWAPARVQAGPEGLSPPLRLSLTMQYGDRRYQPADVPVALSDDTVRRIIPSPVPVDIAYARRPVTVDGDLGEWADVRPMPLPFDKRPTSSFRFVWQGDGLYGAVAIQDSHISVNSEAPWTGDAVELFIEKDFARSVEQGANTAQYVLSPAPEAGPGAARVLVAYDPGGADKAPVACAWRPAPGGYVLEFLIPAARLEPARMEAGCVLGLNFALSNGGRPVEQFYSDKDPLGWRSPVTWGAVRLTR
jgi:predicted phosphodiesterase